MGNHHGCEHVSEKDAHEHHPHLGRKPSAEKAARGIDLSGKTAIITGCSAGIGVDTARVMLRQKAFVVMACRNLEKTEKVRSEIIKTLVEEEEVKRDEKDLSSNIIVMKLDLSSLQSVYDFAAAFKATGRPIHYLINNAGVAMFPEYRKSKEAYELQFAINHLGHFYLTSLLLPILQESKPTRIVTVSSTGIMSAPDMQTEIDKGMKNKDGPVEADYSAMTSYAFTKACNVLYTQAMAHQFGDKGITAVAVHPGMVVTDILEDQSKLAKGAFKLAGKMFGKNTSQGAATTLFCVSEPAKDLVNGGFYANCHDKSRKVPKQFLASFDDKERKLALQCWQWSELLITQKGFEMQLKDQESDDKKADQ